MIKPIPVLIANLVTNPDKIKRAMNKFCKRLAAIF